MPKPLLSLTDYAQSIGKSYRTVWRYYKKGVLVCRKDARGRLFVVKAKTLPKPGRPVRYSRQEVLHRIYQLCKDKYISTAQLPGVLYKLCRNPRLKLGSLRQVKWELGILRDKRRRSGRALTLPSQEKEKFLRWVESFCAKRYQKANRWSGSKRSLAASYCRTVQGAKWQAGILKERRKDR